MVAGTNAFRYRNGELAAEDVELERIAGQVGTPFYCYASAEIEARYGAFAAALGGLSATICYAVKANGNIAVISTLARLGAGADVVSAGELRRALVAGVPAGRIVFSGVGKTADEMTAALAASVMQINVESAPELEALGAVAQARGTRAPVALRINPDVDALTHRKITTGLSENKFGITWTEAQRLYAAAERLAGIRPVGLAVHIGSQLMDIAPYRHAYERMADLVTELRSAGHEVRRLDLGGGLGVAYGGPDEAGRRPPTAAEYACVVREILGGLGCELVVEPGRALVGPAGVLVTRVLYVKRGAARTFVVVDAAMNDLLRPALYEAYHTIVPVRAAVADARLSEVDVVGPVCETGDTFATARALPPISAGDLLAIGTAGAYGSVMGSAYNARALTPEVMVRGGTFAVVRRRVTVDDLLACESIPDWSNTAGAASAGATR